MGRFRSQSSCRSSSDNGCGGGLAQVKIQFQRIGINITEDLSLTVNCQLIRSTSQRNITENIRSGFNGDSIIPTSATDGIPDSSRGNIIKIVAGTAVFMKFFNKFVDNTLIARLTNLVENEFGHVTYTEAIEILEKSGKKFDYPVKWGIDMQTEHERYLTEEVFGKPVFVTDYPADIKAFYMRLNDDGKTVAAMDMLVPGVGELIGGSQREERMDMLLKAMEKFHLKEEDYWWYLELRKYGGTKHAGFGLGFERLIMYITGVSNIRDVESYPRTTGSAEF